MDVIERAYSRYQYLANTGSYWRENQNELFKKAYIEEIRSLVEPFGSPEDALYYIKEFGDRELDTRIGFMGFSANGFPIWVETVKFAVAEYKRLALQPITVPKKPKKRRKS